jgi:prepilin-type N-terminal cleavage/methylation domain-containing protein
MRMKHYTRRHAFSLLELLVVIGIIVALAALLLPVLGGARESAKRAQCLSNLRQLTVAWIAYAHDNESHICSSQLGRSWSWSGPTGPNQLRIQIEADLVQPHPELENGVLWSYLKNAAVYRCPDDQSDPLGNRCSFQINGYLAGTVLSGGAPALMKLDDITQSSKTFVWIIPRRRRRNLLRRRTRDFLEVFRPWDREVDGIDDRRAVRPDQNQCGFQNTTDLPAPCNDQFPRCLPTRSLVRRTRPPRRCAVACRLIFLALPI